MVFYSLPSPPSPLPQRPISLSKEAVITGLMCSACDRRANVVLGVSLCDGPLTLIPFRVAPSIHSFALGVLLLLFSFFFSLSLLSNRLYKFFGHLFFFSSCGLSVSLLSLLPSSSSSPCLGLSHFLECLYVIREPQNPALATRKTLTLSVKSSEVPVSQ